MKISYVLQVSINRQKWDHCIDNADNGVIYAYSFYLDTMSKHWDALILGDYEMVMPLAWNKKYTIHYLYQPFFCAQLGIFGNNLNAEIINIFFKNIPSKFKYWDFYLNGNNLFFLENFPMYERSNYILSLVNDYEQLFQSFTKSHIRNIKRAIKLGNNVRVHIPIEDVVKLAKDQTKKFSTIAEKDYKNFLQLYKILKKKGMAITYGVYNLKKDLIASCAYFFSHKRAYYILVGNHPEGRITGASHMMIDYFIKEHASEDLLLDFEGSNIKSLAFFYKSFGAVLEKYPGIKMNKLPGLVKLFRQ